MNAARELPFSALSLPQFHTLRSMVLDWIAEGTTPPYTDEQYDIFEALDLPARVGDYDLRRPS